MDAPDGRPSESRIEKLERLRLTQELAIETEGLPVRDFAGLSREYRATLAEIDELTPAEIEGDVVDEIARRRAARRSSPSKRSGSTKRTG